MVGIFFNCINLLHHLEVKKGNKKHKKGGGVRKNKRGEKIKDHSNT
jgi:hypothetical protein